MQKIILGITGSIAAYKAAEIIRELRKRNIEVQVVMTEHAQAFMTSLTLQALSGKPVLSAWSAAETDAGMDHIALARWADHILIAPASANFLAHLCYGVADDLLSTLCLATNAPISIAPAMNAQMWEHAATKKNIQTLQQRGVMFLGPASGEQACGEFGLGRMLEPEEIISTLFENTTLLAGKRILITAGPTREAIDPVRFISNHSSGKMGFALAEAAMRAGAKVTLIAGPVTLSCNPDIERIDITTAQEMYHEVINNIHEQDIFICAAAVADYHPRVVANQKLKKTTDTITLELERTPDILGMVTALPQHPFTIGFALETEGLIDHAREKLARKRLHMIVANNLSHQTGFNCDTNAANILYADGAIHELPLTNKMTFAQELIRLIAEKLSK